MKRGLEGLRKLYGPRYLFSDPLELVHRFARPEDQEIVGLLASSLAFGNVTSIRRSVERILDVLGDKPASYVRNFEPQDALRGLRNFHHRWIKGRDVVCLIHFARQMIERAGSIGGFFHRFYESERADVSRALARFSEHALALDHGGVYPSKRLPNDARARYFFPSPEKGGACKRLNLYLRWMIRPSDGLDLGLWDFASPSRLIIPLDTHMSRIGLHLGWTRRRTPDWKTALDITRSLRGIAPRDPTRYDFALTRLGILEGCPRHPAGHLCDLCTFKRFLRGEAGVA